MSKGEDVQAYSRILKFQNKRYGFTLKDFVLFLTAFILMILGTIIQVNSTSSTISSVVFIIAGFYAIVLILAFVDFSLGLGIFTNNQIVYSSIIILFSVIITIVSSAFSSEIFISGNPNLLSFVVLIHYLLQSFFISYFILTTTPIRQGREEMISKLTEIRDEIDSIPITELGSRSAAKRALRWLQFQQREDGIWGEENPLYETSEVLRTLIRTKDGLEMSWKQIISGQEEIRTVEQTYYLVMEALDTAVIEPSYEMLIPVLAVAEINPEFVNLESEIYLDFIDEIDAMSEWEFVQNLEDYFEGKSPLSKLPIIFPMSKIFYLKNRYDVAQKCADVFSQTFDILIRRSTTRFHVQPEKEISNLLLGKMYNSLVMMLRGHKKADSMLGEFNLDISSQLENETPPQEDLESPVDDFSLPAMDQFEDPDIGFSVSETAKIGTDQSQYSTSIKIDISMASIRNYLRGRQSIDGSWSGRIDTTAECLQAISDQESTESNFIKLAVHYLLALQEKNGSWQDDIILTANVLRALQKVNKSLGLGVY